MRISFSFLLVGVTCLTGCNHSFNPKGPFDEEMVVFAILSTNRDEQFVRVYSTYNPPQLDPLEYLNDTSIRDAMVFISAPTGTISFRDTILQRQDTSRYRSPIPAFVASPFRAEQGKSYTVTATSSIGVASATITIPHQATITYTAISFLDDPLKARGSVTLRAAFSKLTSGYWFRFLVLSEVHRNGTVVLQQDTIPEYVVRDTTTGLIHRYYTKLEKATGITANTIVNRDAYIQTVRDVIARNPGTTVIFKQVKIELTLLEENLYKYYSVINGFADKQSIRTDLPDFSNLSSARGIFGGYGVDTLIHILPDDFPFNQQY